MMRQPWLFGACMLWGLVGCVDSSNETIGDAGVAVDSGPTSPADAGTECVAFEFTCSQETGACCAGLVCERGRCYRYVDAGPTNCVHEWGRTSFTTLPCCEGTRDQNGLCVPPGREDGGLLGDKCYAREQFAPRFPCSPGLRCTENDYDDYLTAKDEYCCRELEGSVCTPGESFPPGTCPRYICASDGGLVSDWYSAAGGARLSGCHDGLPCAGGYGVCRGGSCAFSLEGASCGDAGQAPCAEASRLVCVEGICQSSYRLDSGVR